MQIPIALKDLEDKIMERRELAVRHEQLKGRLRNGSDFFKQQMKELSVKKISDGAEQMYGYANEIATINQKIYDIDIIIATRLESELMDGILKCRTNGVKNDAGDNIDPASFYFIPSIYRKDDMVTVDENDLMTFKMLKTAFSIKHIEVIQKEEK